MTSGQETPCSFTEKVSWPTVYGPCIGRDQVHGAKCLWHVLPGRHELHSPATGHELGTLVRLRSEIALGSPVVLQHRSTYLHVCCLDLGTIDKGWTHAFWVVGFGCLRMLRWLLQLDGQCLAKLFGPFLEGHGWLSLRDLIASGFRLHNAAAWCHGWECSVQSLLTSWHCLDQMIFGAPYGRAQTLWKAVESW